MRLLMVEDDPVDRRLVLGMLRALDADVHEASTLEIARVRLDELEYDCMLLDWRFPGMDGAGFLREVRTEHAELPIVVVSGFEDPNLPERVLQAGAQDYLAKRHLEGRDLVRAISYAVERQRSVAMQTRLAHADRLVSVGRIAAGVAHEVNNPATVIMTNLSVLETMLDHENLDRALVGELVTEGIEAIDRISGIMAQLTGFSRQRSGGLVELPLHELLEECVRLAWPSMRHRARLTIHAGLVPPVVVDRTAMVGVLVNLLVNAQQAVDRAPMGDHEIRVDLDAPADRIVLRIEDSGVGVPEAERESIFEAFVTQREQGLGLGLAICREVVRAHRGTIRVEGSALGGAAFVIDLPFDTGLEATNHPAPPEWTTPLDVLVIEDEINVRQAIVRLLGPHRVVEASNLHEARAALGGDVFPDVILCDLMLDGDLGAALYEDLAREDHDLAYRILFVTGGAVTPAAQRFLDEHRPPLLHKPFGSSELRQAIQELLTAAIARQAVDG